MQKFKLDVIRDRALRAGGEPDQQLMFSIVELDTALQTARFLGPTP